MIKKTRRIRKNDTARTNRGDKIGRLCRSARTVKCIWHTRKTRTAKQLGQSHSRPSSTKNDATARSSTGNSPKVVKIRKTVSKRQNRRNAYGTQYSAPRNSLSRDTENHQVIKIRSRSEVRTTVKDGQD